MTEFDLDQGHGTSKKQTPICTYEDDSGTCGDNHPFNSCATVTAGGDYIIADESGDLYKLGKCG